MIRDWIAAERRQLATILAGLSPEQWDGPSLCDGWAVRHVVAHLTMPFRYSTPRFVLGLVKARGSFQRMSDGIARRDGELPRDQLIAAVADNADHPWKPPGAGYEGPLTHDVIHGLDITRGMGLDLAVPAQPMAAVLDAVVGSRSRQHFGVAVDGVRLAATDLEWSFGSGPSVHGQAQDLALLLTGRRIPDGALTGPGATMLAEMAGLKVGSLSR
jgi:uncharacterized protein (TIGR03083 family)